MKTSKHQLPATAYLPKLPDEIQNLQTCSDTDGRKCGREDPTSCPQHVGRAETVPPRRMRTERRRTTVRNRAAQSPTIHHRRLKLVCKQQT